MLFALLMLRHYFSFRARYAVTSAHVIVRADVARLCRHTIFTMLRYCLQLRQHDCCREMRAVLLSTMPAFVAEHIMLLERRDVKQSAHAQMR